MKPNIVLSGFADEINENFEIQLSAIREFGMKYIEIRGVNGKGLDTYSLEEAKQFKDQLDKNGIGISSIGSPIGKIKITDDFAPHFEKFKHVAALAKLFETPYIRMFSFFMPEGEDPGQYRDEVISRLKSLVDYAAEQNLILLHENEKGIYGDHAARCADLMKALYGDHFKAVFDFANFVQCGQDTMEAYELLKPYITYVHIKDSSGETVVPAGMGDGQVQPILGLLRDSGYSGYLSLEPHLTDFHGLKDLELDAKERNSAMDGKTAFGTALSALKTILSELDWGYC